LSIYDEFVSGYKDHRAVVTDDIASRLKSLGNALTHIMVVRDQIVGAWKPVLKKDTVLVRACPFSDLSKTETQALDKAALKYGEFLALGARLSMEFTAEQ
jgi:hypothetical protein